MRFVLSLLLISSLSFAQDDPIVGPWPFASVKDVASDDVLNVRAGPSTAYPIVGSFRPDEAGIATFTNVPAFEPRWIEVSKGELTGWVSATYLEPMALTPWQGSYRVPQGLMCFGAEPFWSLRLGQDEWQFEEAGLAPISIPSPQRLSSPYGPLIAASGKDKETLAAVSPSRCSDGMADASYPYSIALNMGESQFQGCCTLR